MTTDEFPTSSSGKLRASSQPAKPQSGEGKLSRTIMHARTTKASVDYKCGFLCVLSEFEAPDGSSRLMKEWYPVHPVEEAEALALVGRPVTAADSEEGIYVDEEGNVFQLLEKGETKPIEVERLPELDKTELEVLLEASLKGGQANGKNGGAKRLLKKNRRSGRKQQAKRVGTASREARPTETPAAVETRAPTSDASLPEIW